jgi:hypothetical protein
VLIERWRILIVALAMVPVLTAMSFAQGTNKAGRQTFLGEYGAWYAYQLVEAGRRVCYIVSKPVKMRGKYKKRGAVLAFVTHRPKDKERDVVNFQAGYSYKQGSKATARIGKKSFNLATDRDVAWSRNASEDKVLVAAMVRGSTLVLKGTSKSSIRTTDTYSLKGFSRARKRINRACKVR